MPTMVGESSGIDHLRVFNVPISLQLSKDIREAAGRPAPKTGHLTD